MMSIFYSPVENELSAINFVDLAYSSTIYSDGADENSSVAPWVQGPSLWDIDRYPNVSPSSTSATYHVSDAATADLIYGEPGLPAYQTYWDPNTQALSYDNSFIIPQTLIPENHQIHTDSGLYYLSEPTEGICNPTASNLFEGYGRYQHCETCTCHSNVGSNHSRGPESATDVVPIQLGRLSIQDVTIDDTLSGTLSTNDQNSLKEDEKQRENTKQIIKKSKQGGVRKKAIVRRPNMKGPMTKEEGHKLRTEEDIFIVRRRIRGMRWEEVREELTAAYGEAPGDQTLCMRMYRLRARCPYVKEAVPASPRGPKRKKS